MQNYEDDGRGSKNSGHIVRHFSASGRKPGKPIMAFGAASHWE